MNKVLEKYTHDSPQGHGLEPYMAVVHWYGQFPLFSIMVAVQKHHRRTLFCLKPSWKWIDIFRKIILDSIDIKTKRY